MPTSSPGHMGGPPGHMAPGHMAPGHIMDAYLLSHQLCCPFSELLRNNSDALIKCADWMGAPLLTVAYHTCVSVMTSLTPGGY